MKRKCGSCQKAPMEVLASVFAIVGVVYFGYRGWFGVALGIVIAFALSRWQARCSLAGDCTVLHNVIWAVFLLGVTTQVMAFQTVSVL